jgi:hypothetical protein
MARFHEVLASKGIDVVVEIHSARRSRFAPQFSQTELSRASEVHGVRYLFMGRELGGRPSGKRLSSLEDNMAVYTQVGT